METKQKIQFKRVGSIVLSVSIILLFFLMLHQTPFEEFSIRDTSGTVGYRENPWVLKKGDIILDPQVHIPKYLQLEQGEIYSLTTTIKYDGTKDKNPYCFIHLDHMFCRIFVDGKEVFSYMPEDTPSLSTIKSPGFIFKIISLPQDCLGKEMEIQMLPMISTSIAYGLPVVEFGDISATVHESVVRDVPHDIVTSFCILMGIFAILFSGIVLDGSRFREGMSIGAFSLAFSVYLITECDFNQYCMGNSYYIYILNYISFSLLPVLLMSFMRERLLEKHRKICTGIIVTEWIFFAFEMILHFSGIMDLREFIPWLHCIYFVEMFLVLLMLRQIQEKKKKKLLIIQVVPIMVGMIIDAMIYWLHLEVGTNDATFTIYGVVVFLTIEVIHVAQTSVSVYGESVRSDLYRKMAYMDELTEVGNRRAYDEEIEDVLSKKITFDSMLVISADVNELKYTNDNFGHASGDHLIRNVAKIMMEEFGQRGSIFRIGGDEFAMFLYDVTVHEYEEMLQNARKKEDSFNKQNDFKMSVAIGYEQIWDHKILEAVVAADKKMYEDKVKRKMVREN